MHIIFFVSFFATLCCYEKKYSWLLFIVVYVDIAVAAVAGRFMLLIYFGLVYIAFSYYIFLAKISAQTKWIIFISYHRNILHGGTHWFDVYQIRRSFDAFFPSIIMEHSRQFDGENE